MQGLVRGQHTNMSAVCSHINGHAAQLSGVLSKAQAPNVTEKLQRANNPHLA